MKPEKNIDDIINIPTLFNKLGTVTFPSLLENTGYYEIIAQVTEDKIFERLVKHPEWVQQWLNYSDDQRINSGWYFYKDEDGKYLVGYFAERQRNKPMKFGDEIEACAKFIKIQVEILSSHRLL